jgi:WD40 repeat protein
MTAVTLSRAERGTYAWLCVAPGPDRLVAITTDGAIEVWPIDLDELAPFARPARAWSSGLPSIYQLAVHDQLAAVTGRGAVRLYDLDRGLLVRALLGDGDTQLEAVAFTPDGRHLLVAGAERITMIEVATGRTVTSWGGGERTPCIAVHPGGALAHIACSQGGSQVVVDALIDGDHRTGNPRIIDVACDACTPGGFSPDGALLAFAARHVQLHRVADLAMTQAFDYWGEPVATPAADRSVDGYWSNAVFTPDGRHLVCGSPLGAVIVWDLAAGRAAAVHARHAEGVIAVALDPAGQRIFSCSYDRSLRVGPLL